MKIIRESGEMDTMVSIKEYDFFAENKKDFYERFSHKSILCQGKHREKPPLVSILITTYKRPKLLRQALESALNQKGFDDYQIIIADNEGAPIEEKTETEKLVKEYQDEKIIYYRHFPEVNFKTDAAVRLARSPWIVILHDDDILASNHLAVMTNVVRKHKEIKFLSCKVEDFGEEQDIKKIANGSGRCSYEIRKYAKDTVCFGYWPGWLGTLISRKHYIAVGGMPLISMGCGDKVMVVKIWNRFGAYICYTDNPLYYYRRGLQQSSYVLKDKWEKVLINEFYFSRYVIRRYHRLTYKFWERAVAYYILERCEEYNNGLYHTEIDMQRLVSECNMPVDVLDKNFLYHLTCFLVEFYRKDYVHLMNYIRVHLLKKTDIFITM